MTTLITTQKATLKAKDLLISMTYEELSNKLGITRPTLYKRLADNSWKKGEIALLNNM